ncbi:hypothetical protein D9756_010918 [Leucocoprinus leucothites]|uniref:DUF6534 domain-containing protein n=1 Tax=Leucocoprinus leucothites TaxID=201217 RepID=A0A8H5CRY7_9AGAR|nr:hypothetical protein D9756_010918 [Leucoagaricus leucothites]
MDSVSAPLPEDAALTLGSPIVGACLNWFLYGILVVQYLVYLNHAGQDKVWLRTVVHFMFLLDTAQTCLVMTDIFSWYVYNFGNYETLFRFSVSPIDGPLLDSIIMLTVQLVYCWRLWVLGGWKVLPAVATTLAFVSCVSGTFVGLIDQIEGHEPDKAHAVLELWLFTSAVTDILIACSMGYLLLKYRREQITPTTMAMAKRVVILILETNTVTAAAAITLAIIQLPIAKHTGTKLYVVFGYTIGKMYMDQF